MNTCYISKKRQAFFNQLGLNDYQAFYQLEGQLVSRAIKRPVHRLVLKGQGKEETFFIKKLEKSTLKDLLSSIKKGIGFHTDIYLEQAQVKRYESLGLPIMEVAAWGESFKFGIPDAGFILLEQVPGVGLDEWILTADAEQAEKALEAFGALTARLHQHGITEVTRLQDIICQCHHEKVNLVIIDREHGSLKKQKVDYKVAANNLVRLYLKSLQQLDKQDVAPELTAPFLNGYHAESALEPEPLKQAIQARLTSLIQQNKKYHKFSWLLSS